MTQTIISTKRRSSTGWSGMMHSASSLSIKLPSDPMDIVLMMYEMLFMKLCWFRAVVNVGFLSFSFSLQFVKMKISKDRKGV